MLLLCLPLVFRDRQTDRLAVRSEDRQLFESSILLENWIGNGHCLTPVHTYFRSFTRPSSDRQIVNGSTSCWPGFNSHSTLHTHPFTVGQGMNILRILNRKGCSTNTNKPCKDILSNLHTNTHTHTHTLTSILSLT